ncbi:hypothetical protein M0G74_04415 [Microbulbifer sp. CAU 1566]|nr:hypothetical protein [Microbulbifer sp. CAU 1566]
MNLSSQSVAVPAPEVTLDFYSRTVSEALPIKEFTGKWKNAPGNGENTWTRNRLDTGAWLGDWGVSYTVRYDYQLQYNRATADLYYRDEQGLPPGEGAVPVYLNALQLEADGIKLKRRWYFYSGLFLQADISLLKAREFQDGTIDGLLTAGEQLFSGNANLDYRYTDDLLLKHEFEMPEGEGIAVDITAGYRDNNRVISLQVQDAYNRIRWKQAPYTHGKFDTANRDVEDEVQLAPVFSGWRELQDHDMTMPIYALGRYTQRQQNFQWSLDLEYFADDVKYRPGMRWDNLPGNPYLGYEGSDKQWLLALSDEQNIWKLQLGFDDINLEKAHSLTIAMAVAAHW